MIACRSSKMADAKTSKALKWSGIERIVAFPYSLGNTMYVITDQGVQISLQKRQREERGAMLSAPTARRAFAEISFSVPQS